MTIKSFSKTIFAFAAIASQLGATDMPIPSTPELLKKAEVIVLAKIQIRDETVHAAVVEIFKGADKLGAKEIVVSSPYPEMSFPLRSWIKKNGDNPVILIGKYDEKTSTLVLSWGTASFWPQGAPSDVSASKSLDECLQAIKAVLSVAN